MKLPLFLLLTPTLFAAQITGLNRGDAAFSSLTGGLTIASAIPGPSTSTTPGTVTGPNFVQTTLLATAQELDDGELFAHVELDLTAGPGTSFSNAHAEAISGVLRVTNSAGSPGSFRVAFTSTLSAQALGPTDAFIAYYQALEFFSTATSTWEPVFSNIGNRGTGQTLTPCVGCFGTTDVIVAANSSVDYRLRVYLDGSASQTAGAAVPEPSSFALTAIGALALAAFRRRRAAIELASTKRRCR